MSKILLPARKPEDWIPYLGKPDLHWKEGRSAKATAYSWHQADGFPLAIQNLFDGHAELLLAIPEHKVKMPIGRGESQNDVFALAKIDNALAVISVEAKVDETFGPTVEQWLKAGGDNRPKILAAICQVIDASFPPPGNLRYQLFHRTASAVIEAQRYSARRASMVVQSFSNKHAWFDDFLAFNQFLMKTPIERERLSNVKKIGDVSLTLAWVYSNYPDTSV